MKKFIMVILAIVIISLGFLFPLRKITENKDNNQIDNEIQEENKSVKLTLVGDFLFEQPFYDSLSLGDDASNYFKYVKDYFINDDVTIGNMEVPIGNEGMKVSGVGYNFCAPESIGKLLTTLDLEVLGTANNHTNDRGLEGVFSTLDFFKNNSDIMTVGTYYNEEDHLNFRILEVNDLKLGFLAYTYGTNQKVSNENRQYFSLFKNANKEIDYDKLNNEINDLRSKCDVLIVLMHWGQEFTYTPNSEQEQLASYLNSLGVDIIVGSHSHSMEPIKWIGDNHKTLVYYSLGNFVSADYNITRTNEEFNNAYQVGLLSTLEVKKDNDQIIIDNIKTEPIIDYYNSDLRNFLLIPLSLYDPSYEQTHYRYHNDFNYNFVKEMYENVIDLEFR